MVLTSWGFLFLDGLICSLDLRVLLPYKLRQLSCMTMISLLKMSLLTNVEIWMNSWSHVSSIRLTSVQLFNFIYLIYIHLCHTKHEIDQTLPHSQISTLLMIQRTKGWNRYSQCAVQFVWLMTTPQIHWVQLEYMALQFQKISFPVDYGWKYLQLLTREPLINWVCQYIL